MNYDDIKRWCHNEMRAPADSDIYRRAKTILVAVEAASAPTWLSDAAEALGLVRPVDGAPLALNWTQVLEEIRDLVDDRDHWKTRAEQAEFSLGACRDECAALRQNEAILAEQARPEGYLR